MSPRTSTSSHNTLATSLLVVVVALGASACPREIEGAGGASEWRKVDAGPTLLRAGIDAARQEEFRRLGAEKLVKRMQAVFVVESEQACKTDDECVVTPWHCCPCEHGGKLVGVNRTQIPNVVQRRVAVCPEYTCPTVVSDDPTCGATSAKCVKGQCVVDAPAVAPGAAPKGVDVEAIPDDGAKDAPKGDAKGAGAPTGAPTP